MPTRRCSNASANCCWQCVCGATAPLRDDKVLADWNGMMIAALANAGAALNNKEWIAAAVQAFDFIVKT